MACVLLAVPAIAAADQLEDSLQALKDAQAKKDTASVKKLAAETIGMIQKELKEPAPTAADEKQNWNKRVEYIKSVQVQAEYVIYATALQSEPAALVDLMASLEQLSPKSKYLDMGYGAYCGALSETGAAAKVPAVAEKGLANFPENEDLLMILIDDEYGKKLQDRALAHANRLVAVLAKHPKPEEFPAADWEKKKNYLLGRGYWYAGIIYSAKSVFTSADKSLRAALPYIKEDNALLGPALYYLGFSNYKLGMMTNSKAKVLEGAKFAEQAANIDGPYQQQAFRDANLMKMDAAKMR